MTSSIDPSKPAAIRPTMKSVRDNFAAAKAEIEALQVGQSTHYEAVVTGLFNEDVVYVDGSNKVPDFVVDESGDIVYAEEYN